MVKLFARVLTYNWRHYAVSVFVFVAFWQMFSVFSAVRVADDKLLTAMRQNAAYFEKAFLEGDVFETQRIMWRIKNENIKRITFHPVEFKGTKWIFKEAIVGNLYNRPYTQIVHNVPFISNGAELGRLEYVIDLVDVNAAVFGQNYILFITVVFFFLGLLTISNLGAIQTLLAIERSVNEINAITASGRSDIIRDSIKKYINSLPAGIIGTPFAQMTDRMSVALSQAAHFESELAVSKAMSDMATQVAHDIRSPLTALDAVLNKTDQLPEKQRVMVRNAVNRIRDIANDLLEKNQHQVKTAPGDGSSASDNPDASKLLEVHLLSSLIDPVITEKRLQFESRSGINIDFELTRESYGLFARIQPVEFRRMVSNLVNNAVESLKSHKSQDIRHYRVVGQAGHKQEVTKGEVTISLSSKNGKVILVVKDNGKGILPEILTKIGQRGETHGKSGGSGLGLFHARTTVERWGGILNITSKLGKGTTITLNLPAVQPPDWFVSELGLKPNSTVVILDDDTSIHQVWQGLFDSAKVNGHDIEIIHFSEPDKLREWVKNKPVKADNALYLFDYEFLGYKETGLSLAEELGLCVKTILVTSRCEEKRIIEECKRLKIRMIPKGLASIVPIVIQESVEEPKTVSCAKHVDAVLVDDDNLVRMNWEFAAETKGIKLIIFDNPAEFIAQAGQFPKGTAIYLDSELDQDEENGTKGENIAQDLHNKGFTNIILETGHLPEKFAHLPWLKVTDKKPPWN